MVKFFSFLFKLSKFLYRLFNYLADKCWFFYDNIGFRLMCLEDKHNKKNKGGDSNGEA